MKHDHPTFYNIKEINKLEVKPSHSAWIRLEDKMKRNRIRRRMYIYRNIAVAASFIAVVFMSFYFYKDNVNAPDKTFATNHLYVPAILESLPEITDDPFYNPNKLLHYEGGTYIDTKI